MTWGWGAPPDSTTTEGPDVDTIIKSGEYIVSEELGAMNLRVLRRTMVNFRPKGERVALSLLVRDIERKVQWDRDGQRKGGW
jgi:hypothetical protein